MDKKKVFLFLPTLTQGGAERIASGLSCNFPENIESDVVLFENKALYPYKGRLINLNTPFSTNPFVHVYNFVLRLIRFKLLLLRESPDYVVSFINTPNVINILTNRKKAIVRVDVALSESERGIQGFFFRLFVRYFFPLAKWVAAGSQGVKLDLISNFHMAEEKIRVVFNPIDIDAVRAKSKEPLNPEYQGIFRSPVIITLGRLGGQKAQWHPKLHQTLITFIQGE